MQYRGTRTNELVGCADAILSSLDSKKGLFMPECLYELELDKLYNKSYQDVAFEILKFYFSEFDCLELKEAINLAYSTNNFETENIFKINSFERYGYLELFHGNTYAFKDMALVLYPYLVKLALKQNGDDKKLFVLTATSGDTGKAALEAIKDVDGVEILVIYPNDGVSKTQQLQMQTQLGSNVDVVAINGNFDDAQSIVKKVFNSKNINKMFNDNDYYLISANSINIARLLPQVVYYVKAYLELVETNIINKNDSVNISIPTGNFGNLLAAYIAKNMGLPIDKIICASNENNILTEFFSTGIYDIRDRELIKTNAPSMDIIISSNLERYLYMHLGFKRVSELYYDLDDLGYFKLTYEELNKITKDLLFEYTSDVQLQKEINDEYKNGLLIDPHTAIAKVAYNNNIDDNYTLIVATASPFKFINTIKEALPNDYIDEANLYPVNLKNLNEKRINFNTVLEKSELVDYISNKLIQKDKFSITIPATTANIGCGFDCAGIALSLYNKFYFDFSFNGFKIETSDNLYCDKHNLVYKTYQHILKKYNKEEKNNFYLKITSNIPISRGLGSSSTCILAGIIAANIHYNLNLSDNQIMYEACLIETHPDNVVPAYLGNMVSAVMNDSKVYYSITNVNDKLSFYASIDPNELETKKARQALPTSLTYQQTIFNISRASLLLKAFETGQEEHLALVSEDEIHQKYRFDLIKTKDSTFSLFEDGNFITYWISGAGSTIMLLADEENHDFNSNIIKKYKNLDIKKLDVDRNGIQIKYK